MKEEFLNEGVDPELLEDLKKVGVVIYGVLFLLILLMFVILTLSYPLYFLLLSLTLLSLQ